MTSDLDFIFQLETMPGGGVIAGIFQTSSGNVEDIAEMESHGLNKDSVCFNSINHAMTWGDQR